MKYRLVIILTGILLLAAANIMAQEPQVASFSPGYHELNVPRFYSIIVTFDRDMDETTFNNSSVIVSGNMTGVNPLSFSYEDLSRTVTCFPQREFKPGEIITVILTTDIKSALGYNLANSFIWSFTTTVIENQSYNNLDEYSITYFSVDISSTCVADFDNDEFLDVAFANNGSYQDGILVSHNNGDGTFGYVYSYPIPDYGEEYDQEKINPVAITAADFDNDGFIDIATANHGENVVGGNYGTFTVFWNDGTGRFDDSYTGNWLYYPLDIGAADMNGDGIVDLVVLTETGSIRIFTENETRTFISIAASSVATEAVEFEFGDFDNDGDLDIFEAVNQGSSPDHYTGRVAIYLNDGNGYLSYYDTFPLTDWIASSPPTPTDVKDISIGDFNGDGYLDVTGTTNGRISILNSDGFGSYNDFSICSPTWMRNCYYNSLSVSDVNGDGYIDIIYPFNDQEESPFHYDYYCMVLYNDGTGFFDADNRSEYFLGEKESGQPDYRDGICAADINNDRMLDIVIGNESLFQIISYEENAGTFTVSPSQNELDVAPESNITFNFGTALNAASLSLNNVIVRSKACGFCEGEISYDPETFTATYNPANDFNAGDIITVTLTNQIENIFGLPIENSYTWSFTVGAEENNGLYLNYYTYGITGTSPRDIIAFDVTGDKVPELQTADYWFTSNYFENDGNGLFTNKAYYPITSYPYSLTADDFNNDGEMDFAVVTDWTPINKVYTYISDEPDYIITPYDVTDCSRSVCSGDFDADGDADIVVTGYKNIGSCDDNLTILWNDNGTFDESIDLNAGNNPTDIFTADINNDFNLDLIVTNFTPYDGITILTGDGIGGFTNTGYYPTTGAPMTVIAADFDADGYVDLAVANYVVSIFFNDGTGHFPTSDDYVIGGGLGISDYLTVNDFDADGDLDLACPSNLGDEITFLMNSDGFGDFSVSESIIATDYIQGICSADLDADGDIDLAVTNRDLNQITVFLMNELIPGPLIVKAPEWGTKGGSSVNIKVTDRFGNVFGKDSLGNLEQTIPSAVYAETDLDSIMILKPLPGEYLVEVVKEAGATERTTYSVIVKLADNDEVLLIDNEPIPEYGVIDSTNYFMEGEYYLCGDVDGNDDINILDVVYIVNFKYKEGPDPVCTPNISCADVDNNGEINILDVVYLINFKYKEGPDPDCP